MSTNRFIAANGCVLTQNQCWACLDAVSPCGGAYDGIIKSCSIKLRSVATL